MTNQIALQTPLAFIIEDDEEQAAIFSKALKMAAFETEILSDGRAALERLSVSSPALILLDLHLPLISGREIFRHIKKAPDLSEVKIILATADPITAGVLRDDCDLVLIKPISPLQLRDLASRLRPKA